MPARRKRTLYDVLDLRVGASHDEIKHAYRALARRYHPDTAEGEALDPATGATGTEEKFHELQAAYDILRDESARRRYDHELATERLLRQSSIVLEVTSSHTHVPLLDEPQMLYVTIDVSAALREEERPDINLCLVLDRSQSMAGARMQQAKEAALHLIDRLGDRDRLSVVTFSDRARRVIDGLAGKDRAAAKASIFAIEPSGGTELLQGFSAGVEALRGHRDPAMLDHLILLTDGHTYGDDEGCRQLAAQAAVEKIGITLLGLGHEWNDALLDEMASLGAGHSTCIDSPARLVSVIEDRFQRLGRIVARDLQLRVRVPPEVAICDVYRLVPDISRVRVGDGGRMALGTLETAPAIRLLAELTVAGKQPGPLPPITVELGAELLDGDSERIEHEEELPIAISDEPGGARVSLELIETLARIAAFQVQEKAVADVARGDIPRASRRLESLSTHLLDMGEDALAREVRKEAGQLARTGALSDGGRMRIRYGTRALALPAPSPAAAAAPDEAASSTTTGTQTLRTQSPEGGGPK